MQNLIPFGVLRDMSFDLLAEFRIFQTRLETVGDAAAPRERHAEVWFGFGVGDRVISFGFNGFSGEVFEARWKGVAERFWHGVDERGIRTRCSRDIFPSVAREKLTGFCWSGLTDVAVFADFRDGGGAGFEEDFGFVRRCVNEYGACRGRGGKRWSFVSI